MSWLLSVAWAAGGAGVEGVMTQFVTMVLAVAGLGLAICIGWHGIRIAASQNFMGIAEVFAALAVGGGLIFGARPLAAQVTGGAAGAVFDEVFVDASLSMFVGDLMGLLLTALPAVFVGVLWYRMRHQARMRHHAV